jgi:thiosulfate/3-mercaptopyruvate sulfurtransferase
MLPPPVDCGMTPWISPEALQADLDAPDLRVVDVRSSLADREAGRRAYRAGHLPGAIFLDLDTDLSDPPGRHGGRHPLPDATRAAATFGAAGIGRETRVVVYDDAAGMIAGRLWWMLRWLGHERVQVLDGGVAAWLAAGGTLVTDVPRPAPAVFEPRVRDGVTVDRDWLLAHLGDPGVVVVDARAPERYRGDVEPIDPRGGHIPGAINRPFAENLENGRFRPLAELADRYRDLQDAGAVVVYCGSGVSAAHDLMALEACGITGARLYTGSWSDWVSYDDAPVALGAEPGGG